MAEREMFGERLKPVTLFCPHCFAGIDGVVLGLIWDSNEDAWRCIHCGHRTFEQKPKTNVELLEEALWDRVLASIGLDEDPETITEASQDDYDAL
jgi:hypothetical protein